MVRAHGLEQMAKNNNVRIFVVVGPLLLVCLGLHFALVHRTSRESGAAPADVAHVASQLAALEQQQAALQRALAGWHDGGRIDAAEIASLRSLVAASGGAIALATRETYRAPSAASESPAAALMPQGLGAVLPPAAPAPPAQQAPPAQPAVASPRPPRPPRPPASAAASAAPAALAAARRRPRGRPAPRRWRCRRRARARRSSSAGATARARGASSRCSSRSA